MLGYDIAITRRVAKMILRRGSKHGLCKQLRKSKRR